MARSGRSTSLKVIKRAASLGGVESICSLPILTSQYGLTDDELVKAGVSKGMIRMSIGLEDSADLIDDLDQALSVASGCTSILSSFVSCRNSSTSSSIRWLMRLPS